MIVTCLTGFYADTDTHKDGATDCPMSFNETRELKRLIAPQKFHPDCRDQLAQLIGPELPSLDALLKVFHQ